MCVLFLLRMVVHTGYLLLCSRQFKVLCDDVKGFKYRCLGREAIP